MSKPFAKTTVRVRLYGRCKLCPYRLLAIVHKYNKNICIHRCRNRGEGWGAPIIFVGVGGGGRIAFGPSNYLSKLTYNEALPVCSHVP